jgi:hypothetical protein
MKKIFILICALISLISFQDANAQSFSMEKDTVRLTYTGTGLRKLRDSVIVPASSSLGVKVRWYVKNCNFPTDWVTTEPGICDNRSCYSFGGSNVWPGRVAYTSDLYYTATGSRDYHMQLLLNDGTTAATTSGTYYCTVQLVNISGSDSTTATFAVTYSAPSSVGGLSKSAEDITLYPNPAQDEVNLIYDINADVKNISVYNIIGKLMTVYRVSGNSANLNLENIPSGIYFARLVNAHGEVVGTRKFTKQ